MLKQHFVYRPRVERVCVTRRGGERDGSDSSGMESLSIRVTAVAAACAAAATTTINNPTGIKRLIVVKRCYCIRNAGAEHEVLSVFLQRAVCLRGSLHQLALEFFNWHYDGTVCLAKAQRRLKWRNSWRQGYVTPDRPKAVSGRL